MTMSVSRTSPQASGRLAGVLRGQAHMERAARCILSVLILCLSLGSCERADWLQRIVRPKTASYDDPGSLSVDELKVAIEKYSTEAERKKLGKDVDEAIGASSKLGTFYLMLGRKYVGARMFKDAYDVFALAAGIFPDDPSVYYNAALSAAYLAKSQAVKGPAGEAETDRWMAIAESSYRRAIEIKPTYAAALYGLAVLYALELGRPSEAVPLLTELLRTQTRDVDAMMLLARVYAQLGRLEDAANWYETAALTTVVPAKKSAAEENRAVILKSIGERDDGP
jgi:tetratricopeptide (TPR) repeat protein